MLSSESVTPSEVAKKLGINYKTAKDALMHLAITRKDVRYKKTLGGYIYSGGRKFGHELWVFWKGF
jgi:ribosomal protein S25